MNKAELLSAIAAETATTKADCERFLDAFVHTVTVNMASKDGVKIPAFGTFSAKQRKARAGRNPKTGETLQIPACVVPAFKPGAPLKEALKAK